MAVRAARPFIRTAGEQGTQPARVTILMMNAFGPAGAPRAIFNVAAQLAATHEVDVVNLVRRRRKPAFRFPPGVTVTSLDDHRRHDERTSRRLAREVLRRFKGRLIHPADILASSTTLWTDVLLVRRLSRVRGGVVLATRPSLNILAAQMSRPGLAVIGQDHRDLSRRSPSLVESMRRSYGALDALVVLTDTDRRRYEELLGTATRVVTLPNSVPDVGERRSELSQPVVLAAGRLTRQKGFDLLIRSFARVAAAEPGWSLRICGKGPRREELQRLIDGLNLSGSVELAGWARNIAVEMERASIFALSSRSEGFPLVLLEAMSKGLPAVSYDCPTGPADIVEDGRTGFLIPPGEVDAFGDAIIELIRDASKRRRLGTAAAERARGWDGEHIGRRWERLLAELSPQGGTAPPADLPHRLG